MTFQNLPLRCVSVAALLGLLALHPASAQTSSTSKSTKSASSTAATKPAAASTAASKSSSSTPAAADAKTDEAEKVSEGPPAKGADKPKAVVATIKADELKGFAEYPAEIRKLITDALDLTTQNLCYMYGSCTPTQGGMDCSGTVSYLLKKQGVSTVPRTASAMYTWAWKNSRLYPVISTSQDTFELEALKPGDLLFWSGTYKIDRDPPVTHVMIYLGKNASGKRVMVGSSSGRSYDGVARHGVSVFDFRLPKTAADAAGPRFVGYAKVPGLEKKAEVATTADPVKTASVSNR